MSNQESSKRRPAKGPRVGLAQLSPSLGDLAANLDLHRAAIAKGVEDGCDLLVFPELSLAGYRLKDSVPDVAISRGSETWTELEKLSEQVAFVVGFVEESPDHLFYNSAAYFEGGKCLAVHRKTYLPTYGMFDEQRYFARGRGIAAFDTKVGRVAMLICEDMLHPSAVTIAACDGATMIVVPSASPARGVTSDAEADSNARSWEAYLQVMARSFGVWVAYCNRTGVEDGVSFWGGSEIVSPAGERLAKAAYYDEDSASGVLSEDAVRRRRIVNPLVRDEDLDLTINELSRIRGRKVVEEGAGEAKAAAPRGFAPRERREPREGRDGETPPRRFAGPPPRFHDDPREHRPPEGFRPKGRFEQRGGFGRPRFDDRRDDRPRRDEGGDERPRFGGGPRFGRDRDDGPRGGFGRPRFDDRRDDRPRRDEGGDERPRFGGGPRFGRDRDDAARPRGGFGRGEEGGFAPPRAPRPRGEDGGFAPRPRERQRPEPGRKPFAKPFQKSGGFGKPAGKPFGKPAGGFARGGKPGKPTRPRTRKDD